MVKNVFAMLKYNQYKSYKKPTTKKATTISWVYSNWDSPWLCPQNVKYILTLRFRVFPVKLRQRYAWRYDCVKDFLKKIQNIQQYLKCCATKKMKFSFEDFFSKCDQIRMKQALGLQLY